MPAYNNRGGASRTCICSHCGKPFLTRKYQPFCSAICKHQSGYKSKAAKTTSQPILEGATSNDNTNHIDR